MKSLTEKTLMSLAVIAVAALLLAAALFVGGHAVALAQNAHDDLLLVALALGGATLSMVNNLKRERAGATKREAHLHREASAASVSREASVFHIGA